MPRGSQCPSRCRRGERNPWDPSRVLSTPGAACFSSVLRTGQMDPCPPAKAGRSCVHWSPECCQGWRDGRARASAGHGSVGTHSWEEGRQGLGQAVLVMCQFSGASRPQPRFQLLAPHPSWAGQSWEHCLLVSTDGLLLSFLLQWQKDQQQQKEEKGAALALRSVVEPSHCPGCQR